MKPALFIISLLLGSLSFSASAQQEQPAEAVKTIKMDEAFTAIAIESDMTVILTEGKSDKITIEGDVHAISAKVIDGHLYLAAHNPRAASRAKVYVPADLLSKVFMNGNGLLSSSFVLSNQKLKIFLTSEGHINVRSKGNLAIESASDIQFVRGR